MQSTKATWQQGQNQNITLFQTPFKEPTPQEVNNQETHCKKVCTTGGNRTQKEIYEVDRSNARRQENVKRTLALLETLNNSQKKETEELRIDVQTLKKAKVTTINFFTNSSNTLITQIKKEVIPHHVKVLKEKYNGTGDPQDHIVNFISSSDIYGATYTVKCKAFLYTLKRMMASCFF